ncbi:MAG: hypothetical protein ACOVNU_07800 [Candidatus Kapaibacteriota bacterium]
MKEFRILNIAENFINETNERVLILQLAEIKYGITLPSGRQTYTFDVKGEEFVCKYSERFLNELIEKSNNQEIITFNMMDFEIQYIRDVYGNQKRLYYSNNLKK